MEFYYLPHHLPPFLDVHLGVIHWGAEDNLGVDIIQRAFWIIIRKVYLETMWLWCTVLTMKLIYINAFDVYATESQNLTKFFCHLMKYYIQCIATPMKATGFTSGILNFGDEMLSTSSIGTQLTQGKLCYLLWSGEHVQEEYDLL